MASMEFTFDWYSLCLLCKKCFISAFYISLISCFSFVALSFLSPLTVWIQFNPVCGDIFYFPALLGPCGDIGGEQLCPTLLEYVLKAHVGGLGVPVALLWKQVDEDNPLVFESHANWQLIAQHCLS